MKLICGPDTFSRPISPGDFRVVLYGHSPLEISVGWAVRNDIFHRQLDPPSRSWDLLSIALSVIAADSIGQRSDSSDGWTRDLSLDIAVADPVFWNSQSESLSAALAFLTTDLWQFRFFQGDAPVALQGQVIRPTEDCLVLLSGGLDSLVGAIDLVAKGKRPYAISQIVRGDAEKQFLFAQRIGGGLQHLALNHNVNMADKAEPSQRARSLIFITYAVLVATSLQNYYDGETVPLYICENGFIAINPALTGSRIGSLSTRTAHPEYLGRLQSIFDAAGLRIRLENPYAYKTKGEMLRECLDQALLERNAVASTSCGRYQRFNYHQCGRCVPCQVRRAAFLAWGTGRDTTKYVYENLGRNHSDYAGFDDIRSVAIALLNVSNDGVDKWLGRALSSQYIEDRVGLRAMLERGVVELRSLHDKYHIR